MQYVPIRAFKLLETLYGESSFVSSGTKTETTETMCIVHVFYVF